ncbi:MAG: SprT-like domain-containing protein [Porticoccaceae bacterium]|nr:SprT-like domain-containing protein [Porticoccaceae bacterium]
MSSARPPQPVIAPPAVTLEPIGEGQQALVVAETEKYIRLAESLFDRQFPDIPVLFDLSGRASGMYRVVGSQRCIRYNPYIFALYFDEHLTGTVAHEVGHYIADSLYGLANIKPHGSQWRGIMAKFGVDGSRTFAHSLEGVPQRRHRRVSYSCGCSDHQLGIRRHNKVSRGQAVYKCRSCDGELRLSPT